MTATVVKFQPVEVSDAYRFDADEILEEAKGEAFEVLVILGQLEDGTLWISGNANSGVALVLMERAKHQIVFPPDD